MHLFVGVRGITYAVQEFIDSLHANMMKYVNHKDGRVGVAKLAYHPIQLGELVFPKEHLPNVLKGLGWSGKHRHHTNLQMAILRKALCAKPIPEMDLEKVTPIFSTAVPPYNVVGVYPIGIKEDIDWGKNEEFPHMEGFEQL